MLKICDFPCVKSTISSAPCRYYHNITSNTLIVLETMAKHGVKTLIYSSTCATYGEPEKMPITEKTPQVSLFLCGFETSIEMKS